MPANKTVSPVSNRTRHNSEKPQPRRPTRQLPTDSEPGFIADKKIAILDQNKRIHLPFNWPRHCCATLLESCAGKIRLQRGKLESGIRVMTNDKTHRPFTQITNTIKENQVCFRLAGQIVAHATNSMTTFYITGQHCNHQSSQYLEPDQQRYWTRYDMIRK
jgi:hypothetical protein